MKINCYQNFVKRSNETLQPQGTGVEREVVLKNATSITNPTFILSGFDPSMNYIVVPSWGRKYFVVDYQKGNNDLYEVQCQEDYAGTWKSSIAGHHCYVERTSDASYYNENICDAMLSVEDSVDHIDSKESYVFGSSEGSTGGSMYIFRMVGRGSTGVATFATNSLATIGTLFNPVLDDPSDVSLDDVIYSLVGDPSKYLIGAYYSPINQSVYNSKGHIETVYCGFYDTEVVLRQVNDNAIYYSGTNIAKPTGIYTDFRKTDPAFSMYTLYIPAIGTVQLSADLMDSDLALRWSIDLNTGQIIYELLADMHLVATYSGNCYASLQIGNGDAGMNVGSILKTGERVAIDVATGNKVGLVADAIEVSKSVMSPTPSIVGSASGVASAIQFPNAILTVMQKKSGQFPVNQVGRPCCKNLTLGNLSGYVKCGNASINIAGTKTEKDAVNNLLNSGFYMT